MARYQVLRWQEVPSVVKAFDDDGAGHSRQLDGWFQQEIDRRAMAQGLIGSDEYLEHWAWDESAARDGSVEETLDAVARELAAEFGR